MSNPQFVTVDGVKTPLMTSEGQPAKECCCAAPDNCCLYPYFEPPNPGYPLDDLIDQVDLTINDTTTTLNKYMSDGGLLCFSPSGSDPAWIRQDFAQAAWIVTEDATGNAFIYDSQCLIAPAGWHATNGGTDTVKTEDLFSDTYLVTSNGLPFTVTRGALGSSRCNWSNEDASISFGYNLSGGYKWWRRGFGVDGSKDDPQNDPTGSYPVEDDTFVVS